jgi:hypothetical protein
MARYMHYSYYCIRDTLRYRMLIEKLPLSCIVGSSGHVHDGWFQWVTCFGVSLNLRCKALTSIFQRRVCHHVSSKAAQKALQLHLFGQFYAMSQS